MCVSDKLEGPVCALRPGRKGDIEARNVSMCMLRYTGQLSQVAQVMKKPLGSGSTQRHWFEYCFPRGKDYMELLA